uniref:Putative DNA binding, helix-turn-helix domain containing protein n=1 Tax=viral metagenome TaxID=1070528 RepID=A0A6M3LXC7_9ZZZZ
MTLRERRDQLGCTQIYLAGVARVAPNLLSFMERQRFLASLSQAKRICEVLECEVEDIAEFSHLVKDTADAT